MLIGSYIRIVTFRLSRYSCWPSILSYYRGGLAAIQAWITVVITALIVSHSQLVRDIDIASGSSLILERYVCSYRAFLRYRILVYLLEALFVPPKRCPSSLSLGWLTLVDVVVDEGALCLHHSQEGWDHVIFIVCFIVFGDVLFGYQWFRVYNCTFESLEFIQCITKLEG